MSLKQIFTDGQLRGAVDPASDEGRTYLNRLTAVGYRRISETANQITMSQPPGLERVSEMTRTSATRKVENHWTKAPAAQPKPDPLAQALLTVVKQMGVESAQPGIALDSPAGRILYIMEQGAGSIKIVVGPAGNRMTDVNYTRVSEQELSELTAHGAVVREDGSDIATYILPGHRKSAQVQEMRRATSADLGWDPVAKRYTDAANRGNR